MPTLHIHIQFVSKMLFSMLKFTLLLALCCLLSYKPHYTQACSSRTVPKPRPVISTASPASILATIPTTTTTTTSTTSTTPRPNITFPTYKCPETYDAWYCLNEASCFSVRIGDSIMYNCECAIGFMGPRCEYKELDGSYLPKRPHPMLEKASIASGATCALLFMFFGCLTLYLRYDQRAKTLEDDDEQEAYVDERYDGVCDCASCCCCAGDGGLCGSDTDLLVDGAKYRHSASFRQHFATLPIVSFAFRRSAKL